MSDSVDFSMMRTRTLTILGKVGSFIILMMAFLESMEFIVDRYFTEDGVILEIQQDLQESHFFAFWLKGVSDREYSLETIKICTGESAKVKFQYDDLKKPILLVNDSNRVGFCYILSRDEAEKTTQEKNLLLESRKPLLFFVEFEQVSLSPNFECEFSGTELESADSKTKFHSIECAIKELGYVKRKSWLIFGSYVMGLLFISILLYLFMEKVRRLKGSDSFLQQQEDRDH